MEFRVVIPARYDSARLPGKPLLKIAGKPMIQHVYERAIESGAESVVIATESQRVREAAEKFGAAVCMTSSEHKTGTERIAEAVIALGYLGDEVIVNLQGDEPLIPPTLIRQVAEDLGKFENARVATLYEPIHTLEDLLNPNHVKVVMNERGYALYFSRAPIPWERDNFKVPLKVSKQKLLGQHRRHVGLYAYHVNFLEEYMKWEPSPLEELEKLEQLRVLWHAGRVHLTQAIERVPLDVNTKEDLEKVKKIMAARK